MPDDLAARIETTTALLRRMVSETGMLVSWDGCIGGDDAAKVLGLSPKRLANLRSLGGGPPFYNRRVGSSRVGYKIDELAAHIERGRRG